MRIRIMAGIALVLVSLFAASCTSGVSQEEYDKVKSDLENAQQQQSATEATLAEIQSQLDSIREVCPPGDFATYIEFEDWVNEHVQSPTAYAEGSFRSSLRVQNAGLEDGYLISIDIDYDADTGDYAIGCQAIAGGRLYWWDPEGGGSTIFPWYEFEE